jgi:hypothetical protein
MGTAVEETHEAPEQRTFVVVLRARSSARYKPEEGEEVLLSMPGIAGKIRLRLRTRWVDEGFEAPTPRELWIEGRGPAQSLDAAVSAVSAAGRLLSTILAFCVNTSVGMPELHIAYDASDACTDREFIEVFLADERGHPREGRLARPGELIRVFQNLVASPDQKRISRALQQYDLALRYWYFGGEWLALGHLYMAVEALTRAVIRHECARRGINELTLAQQEGIATDAGTGKCPSCEQRGRWRSVIKVWRRLAINCRTCLKRSRWKDELNTWGRETLIFQGDRDIYQAAKGASDGVEHGFMELSEVHRKAMIATEATFGYVRRAILRVLDISEAEFSELFVRVPRDVESLRRLIKGQFVGSGGNPAPPDEEYPRLEWHSSVKTLKREGERFSLSFQERFTVRCASDYGFKGIGYGVRARTETGQEPIRLEGAIEVAASPEVGSSRNRALTWVERAKTFATNAAAPGRTQGMPPIKSITYGLFSEQVAVYEAIETLLRADRPVEALMLLRTLIAGTCRLEAIAADRGNLDGAALRMRLDAMGRMIALHAGDDAFGQSIAQVMENQRAKAVELGISIPEEAPSIEATPFYREHEQDFRFTEEVARGDELAVSLHTKKTEADGVEIHTQIVDAELFRRVAGMSVLTLVASVTAFTTALRWPYDESRAAELQAAGTRLTEESPNGVDPSSSPFDGA